MKRAQIRIAAPAKRLLAWARWGMRATLFPAPPLQSLSPRRETVAEIDCSAIAALRRGNLAVWATTVQITARYPRQARV